MDQRCSSCQVGTHLSLDQLQQPVRGWPIHPNWIADDSATRNDRREASGTEPFGSQQPSPTGFVQTGSVEAHGQFRQVRIFDACGQTGNGVPNPAAFAYLREKFLALNPGLCPPIANPPALNVTTTASQSHFFLSEIAAGLPGVNLTVPNSQGPLHDFLAQHLCFGPHAYGTLVVDTEWYIDRPIVLQRRTTLAGVGRIGRGVITVTSIPAGRAAIELYQGSLANDGIAIRDLYIGKAGAGAADCGVRIIRGQEFRIDNCRISGFPVGIYAEKTIGVWLENVLIDSNLNGIVLNGGNNAWRVRDCTINNNGCWGAVIFGHADGVGADPGDTAFGAWGNDYQFSGCRVEGNGSGGVYFGGLYGVFQGMHFEANGQQGAALDLMIRVLEAERDLEFEDLRNTGQVKVLSSFIGQSTVRTLLSPSNTNMTSSDFAPNLAAFTARLESDSDQSRFHIEAQYNMYYWGNNGQPFRAPVPY